MYAEVTPQIDHQLDAVVVADCDSQRALVSRCFQRQIGDTRCLNEGTSQGAVQLVDEAEPPRLTRVVHRLAAEDAARILNPFGVRSDGERELRWRHRLNNS